MNLINKQIIIVGTTFVLKNQGTGIVMSVPAHSPVDYMYYKQYKKIRNITHKHVCC